MSELVRQRDPLSFNAIKQIVDSGGNPYISDIAAHLGYSYGELKGWLVRVGLDNPQGFNCLGISKPAFNYEYKSMRAGRVLFDDREHQSIKYDRERLREIDEIRDRFKEKFTLIERPGPHSQGSIVFYSQPLLTAPNVTAQQTVDKMIPYTYGTMFEILYERYKNGNERIRAEMEKTAFGYMRAGHMLFLPHTKKSVVDQYPLLSQYNAYIFLDKEEVSRVNHQGHMGYTVTTALLVDALGFSPQDHVLDLGCSDGIQGIVALRNGAGRVTGIDSEDASLSVKRMLRENGLPRESLRFIRANLFDPSLPQQLTRRQRLPFTTAVLNIGSATYEDVDKRALEIALGIPSIRRIVCGGYGPESSEADPSFIFERLQQAGFVHDYRQAIVPIDSLGTFQLAFSVAKKNPLR